MSNEKLSNCIKEDHLPVLGTRPIRPELILEFKGTEPSESFDISNATSLTIHRSDTDETKTLTGTSSVSIPVEDIPQMGTLTIKDVVLRNGYNNHGTLNLSSQDNLVAIHSYGDLPFTGLNHEDCPNLTNVPNRIPPTVTSLSYCFYQCPNFNDSSVKDWDTSSVTDMSYMFQDAYSFNQPLNNWDTSNVTNMSYMFYYASNFNQPLNNWDTSKVTSMSSMFRGVPRFNGDISDWNTSSVTTMQQMFYGATSFNQDISGWDVSKVTNMSNMFRNAIGFNQDLSYWCVTNILEEPFDFDYNTPNWIKEDRLPVWGTCPRGEDQN